ncbi:MAG TPA: hypothetical protein VM715_10430 [Candidatus Acidoferrum sp.]|nr:hypothetical protein [Candidatus Acidoferrum sp.]
MAERRAGKLATLAPRCLFAGWRFWIRDIIRVFAIGNNLAKLPNDRFDSWFIFHEGDLAV